MHSLLAGLLLLGAQSTLTSQALLEEMAAKVNALESVSGQIVQTEKGKTTYTKFAFAKPDHLMIQSDRTHTYASGSKRFRYMPQSKEYIDDSAAGGRKTPLSTPPGFSSFYNKEYRFRPVGDPSIDTVEGKRLYCVQLASATSESRFYVYIDPETKLPAGYKQVIVILDDEHPKISLYQDLKLNQINDHSAFQWAPPKDAKPYAPPTHLEKLVPMGAKAPGFTLENPKGGTFSLDEILSRNKVVLLNFWFYNCGPCRDEFPHLQKLYDELKGQGFEILAVNTHDSAEVVNRYLSKTPFTFPAALNGKDSNDLVKRYGIQACPTNYVLDSSGQVVTRFVGFKEEDLKAALRKAGLKL